MANTKQTAHTPTPLLDAAKDVFMAINAESAKLANPYRTYVPPEQYEVDVMCDAILAELKKHFESIINSHDKLVEALEAIRSRAQIVYDQAGHSQRQHPLAGWIKEIESMAVAALKAARGE